MVRHYLSNRERILLHLYSYSSDINYYNAPYGITQEGIAEGIGIGRNNVPRELKILLNEGIVGIKKARVANLKNRRNVYYLTPKGIAEAKKIKVRLKNMKIHVVLSPGKEVEISLGEITKRFGLDFETAALNVDKNRKLDIISVVRKRTRSLHYLEENLVVSNIYGRDRELNKLDEFFRSSKKVLFMTGSSGMGKTYLMVHYLKKRLIQRDVFFVSLRNYGGVMDFLNSLSSFLSTTGHPQLERYLSNHGRFEIFDDNLKSVMLILMGIVNNLIFVFDDVQEASKEVLKFLKNFIDVGISNNCKFVIMGTGIPSVLTLLDAGNFTEIHLLPLDRETSYRLLKDRGVEYEDAVNIYRKCGGNPLLLTISAQHGFNDSSCKSLFEVSCGEWEALKFLSVFNKPVDLKAILVSGVEYHILYSLISKNLVQELEDSKVTLHDIVKEHVVEKMNELDKVKYHELAASYFEENGDIIEAVYHFIHAGKLIRASILLDENYEKYLYRNPALIRKLAKEILVNGADERSKSWIMHGIIGDTYIVEGMWDEGREEYEIAIRESEDKDLRYNSKVMVKLAGILIKRGELDVAERNLVSVISRHIYSVRKKDLIMAYYYLSNIMSERCNYEGAEENLLNAKDIVELIGDYGMMGYIYNGLSIVYRHMGDYEKSLFYAEEAKNIMENTGDMVGLIKTILNIGHAYYMKMDNRAEAYFKKAKSLSGRIYSKYMEAQALQSLGVWYVFREKYMDGEKNLKDALSIYRRLGLKKSEGYVLVALGSLYAAMGNVPVARDYFVSAVELGMDIEDCKLVYYAGSEAIRELSKYSDVVDMGYFEEAVRVAQTKMNLNRAFA